MTNNINFLLHKHRHSIVGECIDIAIARVMVPAPASTAMRQ